MIRGDIASDKEVIKDVILREVKDWECAMKIKLLRGTEVENGTIQRIENRYLIYNCKICK